MLWTILFGKWLGTTRVFESKASKWHFGMGADARADTVTVRTGRGANTVHLLLQHMKNHVWRELWPAMPFDSRAYWRGVSWHVMALWDGGGGGMRQAAELAGKSVAKKIATAGGAAGGGAARRERGRAEAHSMLLYNRLVCCYLCMHMHVTSLFTAGCRPPAMQDV